MIKSNCVMLRLDNPWLKTIRSNFFNKYFEYINLPYCVDNHIGEGFVSDPHITLIYGLDPQIGENTLYHHLKIKNRSEYNNLRQINEFIFDELNFGVFDLMDDYGVSIKAFHLKVTSSPITEICRNYHKSLLEYPNTYSYDYNPHVTLTYLKGNIDESIILEMEGYLRSTNLREFKIDSFVLSNPEGGRSVVPINN